MQLGPCLLLASLSGALTLSAADPAWLIAGSPGGSLPVDLDDRLRDVVSISASRNHQVVRGFRNEIDGWGGNASGQLDFPTTTEVAQVSAGRSHTLLLTQDGDVLATGLNTSGQTEVPTDLGGGVIAVAAGDFHSAALTGEGAVRVWGFADYGQTIVPVSATSGVTAIAAGGNHLLALTEAGGVVAWGWNLYGQCNVPVEATAGVSAVVAGEFHSAVLKDDGSVVVWGRNHRGQKDVPLEAASEVTAVASGDNHLIALKSDGTVVAWGSDLEGQATVPAGAQGETVRVAAGGDASFFKIAEPEISVEQPAGETLANGGAGGAFGPMLVESADSLVFQIVNLGDGELNGITAALNGDAAFTLAEAPPTEVDAGTTETFTIDFTSAVAGEFETELTISSNDPDQPSFVLTISATVLSAEEDGDGDGFNDWMEYVLRDLGFDRAVDQSAEADELLAKANEAGLFTDGQFRALSVPNPVSERDPVTGVFTLVLGLRKSDDLESFVEFPLEAGDVSVTTEGEVKIDIESAGEAAFFRIEVGD